MKKILHSFIVLSVILIMAACGGQDAHYPEADVYEMVIDLENEYAEAAGADYPAEPWQEAYIALLHEYSERVIGHASAGIEWPGSPGGWFILHDIDGDGTAELIVADSFHFTTYFAVYGFLDNELTPIEANYYYDYGTTFFLLPGNPTGIGMESNEGVFNKAAVLMLDENRLIPRVRLARWEDYEVRWSINDEEVSELELDELYNDLFGARDSNRSRILFHEITEVNIYEVVLGWTPLSTLQSTNATQEITPFGRQVAIDFLREFPSLFRPNLGFRDENTGGYYALIRGGGEYEWVNINDLPVDDIPIVFQGGVRAGLSDYWYTDTWGIYFNSNFYDIAGNILADVPFIRSFDIPEFNSDDNWDSGIIASSFTLYDLNNDGIPEIVIEFVERGVMNIWGYSFNRPIILYAFTDGAYREVSQVPTIAQGSSGHVLQAPIYYNRHGDVVFYFNDGKSGLDSVHYLRFTEDRVELELIAGNANDSWDWWQANQTYLSEFQTLAGLQNEITEYLTPFFPPSNRVGVPDSIINLWAHHLPNRHMAIRTDTPLHNFELIEVAIGDSQQHEGMIYLYAGETISSIDVFNPNEPFVFNEPLGGATIPARAIAFLDENDVRRYFLLSISGYDGSILLSPYPLDEKVVF